ncbi:uncharacterized protein LOC125315670 isoform X4 [Rhodamnia argentea]|uniref:Uncharacterized protein LOC125315670 isoform X4 n=1 Tax=Rhodamnia argentea TaxID=178133 RepID=A0ABM3HLB1_9MYRT|nr:uncharacterized protein LOC125315670 isoform X4 [Rhodamnia argentea]
MRLTWRSHGFFAVSRQALFVRKPRNSPSWVRATSPQKHVYHDPIPELAASVCTKSFERRKFERDPREKLSGDIDTLGEDLDSVIKVCTQIHRITDSDCGVFEIRYSANFSARNVEDLEHCWWILSQIS